MKNYLLTLLTGTLLFALKTDLQGQELFQMPDNVQTRWASPENPMAQKGQGGRERAGRKGRASIRLAAGKTLVLAQENAGTSGTIRKIWMTIQEKDPEMLSGLKLEFYWDGAEKPAVSAPIGYFFGMGLGKMIEYQSALFSSPEGRSFNCYIPMPFKNGMKMILINETDREQGNIFYDVDYTIGDWHGEDALYFHAWYNRVDSTIMREDYEFLPNIKGRGRYLGVNFGVRANTEEFLDSWWGEGEVKIFLDGDTEFPTLVGTGTEDYIGTGWGQGTYDHFYQGCHFADADNLHYCFYRWHVPDPVWFSTDIRITIQQIGCCFGRYKDQFKAKGLKLYQNDGSTEPKDVDDFEGWLFERYGDDWASCVYFYLDGPTNGLPQLASFVERASGL
jgi:hypothetical protein